MNFIPYILKSVEEYRILSTRDRKEEHTMLGSLIMGAIVGWIAGKLMGLEGGLLRNIIVGIIGSFVGACLFIWLARKILH